MNTNRMELSMNELEQVNGGSFDPYDAGTHKNEPKPVPASTQAFNAGVEIALKMVKNFFTNLLP